MSTQKIDVTFSGETRARQLSLSGPPGITFSLVLEGKREVLFTVGARPLVSAILGIASEGDGGDWAKHLLAALGRASG